MTKPDDKKDLIDASLEETFEVGSIFSEAHVDRDLNVISNVTLLGKISKNGRRYSPKAMGDAAKLYEGVGFYFDHPTPKELKDRQGARAVMDLAGRIRNPRVVGDHVRGDIQVLNREPTKSMLFALAEEMPGMVGNSHRATGKVTRSDDGEVVESLDHVAAIELVLNPATTQGLFESLDLDDDPPKEPPKETPMEIKDLKIDALRESRPDLIEAILAEQKETDGVATLKAENKRLTEWKEKREAEDAARERQEFIEAELEKSKLPLKDPKVVTEEFRSQLMEAETEDKVTAAIADRKQLFEAAQKSTKPKTRSYERDEDEDGKKKSLEEADFGALVDKVFS